MATEVIVNKIERIIEVSVDTLTKEVFIEVTTGAKFAFGDGPPSGDPGTGYKAYLNLANGEWWKWNGSSWVLSVGAGSGDMLISTYDPNAVAGDAFDMGNMVEAPDAKILTAAERAAIIANAAKVTTVVSGDNIVDIDATDPQNPIVTIIIEGPFGDDAEAAANGVAVGGIYYRSAETGFGGLLAIRLT